MWKSLPSLTVSISVGVVFAVCALFLVGGVARARPAVFDNGQMSGTTSVQIRWAIKASSGSPAEVRKAIQTVEREMRDSNLRTSQDFYMGAMIASKGSSAEDALMAHDLACCALALGEVKAKSLIATSTDQFLIRIGRNPRFGMQGGTPGYQSPVSDGMRFILDVPVQLGADSARNNPEPSVDRGDEPTRLDPASRLRISDT